MQCPPFASYGGADALLRKLFQPAAATRGLEAGAVRAGFAARALNAKQSGWRQNLGPTCLTLKRAEESGAGAVSHTLGIAHLSGSARAPGERRDAARPRSNARFLTCSSSG